MSIYINILKLFAVALSCPPLYLSTGVDASFHEMLMDSGSMVLEHCMIQSCMIHINKVCQTCFLGIICVALGLSGFSLCWHQPGLIHVSRSVFPCWFWIWSVLPEIHSFEMFWNSIKNLPCVPFNRYASTFVRALAVLPPHAHGQWVRRYIHSHAGCERIQATGEEGRKLRKAGSMDELWIALTQQHDRHHPSDFKIARTSLPSAKVKVPAHRQWGSMFNVWAYCPLCRYRLAKDRARNLGLITSTRAAARIVTPMASADLFEEGLGGGST